mmetsp:Transcript_34920/g.84345  ORF Transcript_34920/g.84345 Transcript_34920/m.84345 type:complete len:680 (+) Transcript_34920:72-2111(+)
MRVAVALALGACAHEQQSAGAVQKVIQLLENMISKGRAEMQDEQVKFAAYSEFCDNTSASKKKAIAREAEDIENLSAEMEKLEADGEELRREIKGLSTDEDKWSNELTEATAQRKKERKVYQEEHADLSESVDAIERAIMVMKKQARGAESKDALIQVAENSRVPDDVKQVIASFLVNDPEDAKAMGLAQFQNMESVNLANPLDGIVGMLEKLHDKFRAQVKDLEKEEMNAQHAYEMVKMDLDNQVKGAQKRRNDKERRVSNGAKRVAKAKAELQESQATKAEDESYLDDLSAECHQKRDAFQSRQQLRSQELEAIEEAVKILSSPEVSGSADKHLGLSQKKGTSLAQLRSVVQNPVQRRIAAFLTSQAVKFHNDDLAQLADRVSADVFANVKKMIKDMIYKLQEEANEEAEHKGWCDKEVGTNTQTRETKSNEVDDLNSEIEELKAHISKLSEETGDLSAGIAAIDKAMGKATEERNAERAKNEETIADAQDAQKAVQSAMAVMKEFYAKAGQATAMLQQKQEAAMYEAEIMSANPAAPDTFEGPYKGMQGMNGGVVGMLEVILSDFARLEATTHAEEAEAEEEFKRFSVESSRDKAVKSRDIEHKDRQKEQAQSDLAARERDLDATTEELEAAERYYQKLKPSCVDAGLSYDDRVQKREQEIQSLKEALEILKNAYA